MGNFEKKYYASWINDKAILKESSSGGIFTAIASYVIEQKGLVYGVTQDEKTLICYHIEINNIDDLKVIRKSKYYQSDSSRCFSEISKRLNEGRIVLFSGTSCQIHGLKLYLDMKNINKKSLITVDVLCHGVSNVNIYKKYILSCEKRFGKKIIMSEFRTKDLMWYGSGTSMTLYFEDGSKKILRHDEDSYYLAFNENLILRPSCYHCPYSGNDRYSDFTVGDFWGARIEDFTQSELNDGIGITVINSKTANIIWNSLLRNDRISAREVPREYGERSNLSFCMPQSEHPRRKFFFDRMDHVDFDVLIRRIMFKNWLKGRVKTAIGRKNVMRIKWIMNRK